MAGKRRLLFAGAAVGAFLALAGVAIVIWAWLYPKSLVDEMGASVTPDHLMQGLRHQLAGTIGGALAAAVGLGLVVLCFRALGRDLECMRREAATRHGSE